MSLDEFLDAELRPEGAPDEWQVGSDHPWRVEDEAAADWAARKVQRARQAIASKQAEYDRVVAAARDWLDRETKTLEDDATFFEGKLADWLRREIDADPDGKVSRRLPSGVTVKRTGGAASLVVDDEKQLAEWLAERLPTAVEFVAKVDRAAVKKLRRDDDRLTVVDVDTGELLEAPGARIERGDYGFKVVVP